MEVDKTQRLMMSSVPALSPARMCGAGMGHYKALRGGLDILVANEQLELLLSRRSASQSSTGTVSVRLPTMHSLASNILHPLGPHH